MSNPSMRDLFRAYVAKKSTRRASAELVVQTFDSVLAAVQSQDAPHFEESDALTAAVPAESTLADPTPAPIEGEPVLLAEVLS